MHFHADHSLFFEYRQSPWRAALSIALATAVLTVNAAASNATVALVATGLGAVLLVIAYARGHRRIEAVLGWSVALVGATLFGGLVLASNLVPVVEIALRILCGVIWVLWLGSQVDWAALRQILLGIRVPDQVVNTMDHALVHGVLTKQEWIRRRDVARMRLGTSRLPLPSWGSLLGEGALLAFFRLERVEENALLRSSPKTELQEMDGVHLEAIDVKRGGQRVLEQLDLRLTPGEWVLICGPSGAGKSSLLRLLAGLDKPTQGVMKRLGTEVSSKTTLSARLDGRVALLTQNPEHHFIASTAAEDIAWGLRHRGVTGGETRDRVEQVAKALRIHQLLTRPCHQLSFGEQRRVAIAGLLVLEPALLLLDEPTAGLDPVAAHELCTLVAQFVSRSGAACLWATHDLNLLPPQAQRVLLLRDQRILFDGSTAEGLSTPSLIRAGLALPEEGASTC